MALRYIMRSWYSRGTSWKNLTLKKEKRCAVLDESQRKRRSCPESAEMSNCAEFESKPVRIREVAAT